MGQEIFYCWKCKSLLRGKDFEKGKAFRIGDQVSCDECAAELGGAPPPRPARPAAVDPLLLSGDSTKTRLPAAPGKTPRRGTAALSRNSNAGLIVGGAAGGLILLVVAVAALSGKKPPAAPAARVDSIELVPEHAPPPAPRPNPEIPRPRPTERVRDAEGRKALDEAKAFASAHPDDLQGQFARATRAALQAEGTEAGADAQALLESVKKAIAEQVGADLKSLDGRLKEAEGRGDFAGVLKALEESRAALPFPDWGSAVEERRKGAEAAARKALAETVKKILEARRRRADGEAQALAGRADRLGLAEAKAEIAKALSAPVEVLPSPEALAYRKRWQEAAALLAPRDYSAAIKALEAAPAPTEEAVRAEAAADLAALRLAAAVPREAQAALAKWPRGGEMRLALVGGAVLEGHFLRAAGEEVEVLTEEGIARALVAEVAPARLVELFLARAGKQPATDPHAAAAFLALEGEAAEGKPVPANLVAFGRKAAEAAATEAAARRLFREAEEGFRRPAGRGAAGEKYRALLAEHAGAAFVARHRALIEARAEAARESFYWADDLAGSGTFALGENPKVDSCWVSLSESAPGKAPSNYVEFEFHAQADGQTRAWVLAGGCCAETFTFGLQATELAIPNPKDPKESLACDPGSAHHAPVRNSLSLRRLHVQHGGPKEPARWSWIPIPLPKYAAAGTKRARLVTEQQGFGVAYVYVASGRASFPRESDVREMEKARAAQRELLGVGREVATGSILREWWTGVPGSKIPDLAKHPLFPDKPTGSALLSSFEGPAEWSDNYGTRIRGYVHPPATGAYTFWIASDDDGELWLSPDESPLRKVRIAWLEGAAMPRQWDQQPNQKSAPIPLVAGRRYYVEVLHKEGAVNDHLAVGWQLPTGAQERPIPGSRLSPFGSSARAVAKGALYRAINLNGPPLVIDGRAWEGKEAPNVATNGRGLEHQEVALSPMPDGAKAQMIRSFVYDGSGTTLTLSAVPSGSYQVHLYVWEDSEAQVYDVFLEGKLVQERHNSGAPGRWDRLGPWTVEIADGTIEIRTKGGHANLSGIEVWRVK